MADYFTQFSCIFDVGTPENAQRVPALFDSFCERLDREQSAFAGFEIVLDAEDGATTFWIHDSDGYGDVGQVTEFVVECAKALGLKGLWGFEWANTCSRPRIDGFGGGAQVIDLETGSTDTWISTHDWLGGRLHADEPVGR